MITQEEYEQLTAPFNSLLMDAKQVSAPKRVAIGVIHSQLQQLLARPLSFHDNYKDVVDEVERLEYTLQMLWGFPQNSDFHRYWYRVDGCKCPVMDNDDSMGSKYRYYNSNCPVHNQTEE